MEIKNTDLHAQLEKRIAAVALKVKKCWQMEEAFCVSDCPFHYDVREFTNRLKRGSFSSAYRLFANATGFPAIVSALCPEYCSQSCVRKDCDSPIALKRLESASIAHTGNPQPNSYNMPAKEGKIAIIGAGPAGLGCALRLCNKKYSVTVFEKSGRIGGHLWDVLDSDVFLPELALQFKYESYDLRLNTTITDAAALLADYDAVFIATGRGSRCFSDSDKPDDSGGPGEPGEPNGPDDSEELEEPSEPDDPDSNRIASDCPGIFLGGSLTGADTMHALAQGLQASGLIEAYIKTGNMKGAVPHERTKMRLDPSALVKAESSLSMAGTISKEDARAEAGRCIGCRCDACVRSCPLMGYFEKFPLRIEDEVHVTIYPGTLDGDGTVATRLIATCNQCGLCAETCPQNIDMGALFSLSHRYMHNKGSMPWAFHDFWLKDLAHARNPEHYAFHASPVSQPEYLYYPGCQLAASEPNYVTGSYALLLQSKPKTAILLGCCGAPAIWAGDTGLHESVLAEIRETWQLYGQPRMVLACPSCQNMFRQYLPEIETVFLLDLFCQAGITPENIQENETAERLAVFDPCAMRHREESRSAVRELAGHAGLQIEELPLHGDKTRCCSFGGQIDGARPSYSKWLAQENTGQSDSPYLVYCANCRDVFAARGKESHHLLEYFPGCSREHPAAPGIEKRRQNRAETLKRIQAQLGTKSGNNLKGEHTMNIYLAEGLREKLDDRRIFLEEVEKVLTACEADKRRIRTENGHFIGYRQVGNSTCWTEYLPVTDGYQVFNAYAHRMRIETEEKKG